MTFTSAIFSGWKCKVTNCDHSHIYSIVFQIHSVEDFVCSVNAHLTTRQENERLKGIMARIEAYDVVVSVHLNNNNMFCNVM